MATQPTSANSTLAGKSVTHEISKQQDFRLQLLDLIWFITLVIRVAPTPTTWYALVALAGGLTVPLQLWATKSLVDTLAFGGGGVWVWLALMAGALILQQALSGVESFLGVKVRECAEPELRGQAIRKGSRLPLIAFEDQSYFDRLNRVMNEAQGRGSRLVGHVINIIRMLPPLVSYALILGLYAPVLLIITLAALLPVTAMIFLEGKLHWALLNEQTRERRLAEYYAGALGSRANAKEIRLYGLSQYFLERWSGLFWQTRNEQRRLALRMGLRQRGSILGSVALSMFGLWWVVSAGLTQATPGEYALIFTSVIGIFGIGNAAGSFKALGEAAGLASEFRSFARLPEEMPEAKDTAGQKPFPVPIREGIRFENVWFTYPYSEAPALAGVSFEIAAGETVALVGENGAGKSTLAKLLLGFYRPDRGRITYDGTDVSEMDPRSMRRAMSAVFQHFAEYQLTLRENVGIGRPEWIGDLSRIEAASQRAGVDDIASALKDNYEALLGPDVGGTDLSGGQWQRVALARAFFRDAQLLVLDEPTAALDPKAELGVFERFVELAEGRTAVLISHRLGMARMADRVIVLRQGRVVESGAHEALMQYDGEYATLFDAQARWYR